jgi:hypothetical protein
MLKTFAAAAVALAILIGPAVAQDASGAGIVTAQLDAATNELGLTPGARVTGRLAGSRSQMTTIQAPGGEVYFIGACDENCSDLDLVVRDAAGNEVGSDYEPDDAPMVVIPAGSGGRYTFEVQMATCSSNCNWGVRSYNAGN